MQQIKEENKATTRPAAAAEMAPIMIFSKVQLLGSGELSLAAGGRDVVLGGRESSLDEVPSGGC